MTLARLQKELLIDLNPKFNFVKTEESARSRKYNLRTKSNSQSNETEISNKRTNSDEPDKSKTRKVRFASSHDICYFTS